MDKCPAVAVISIGNELLSGRTVNSNLLFLGSELGKIGLPINIAITVKDDHDSISKALNFCLEEHDVVITTGGLGPTSDDISKKVIADYFGRDMITDQEIWEKIQKKYPDKKIPAMNIRQAELPKGSIVLENNVGSAPGLCIKDKKKLCIMLPGVPYEMKDICMNSLIPMLQLECGIHKLTVKTIHTIDVPESSLAEQLEPVKIPEGVQIAFLPQPGRVDVRLVGIDEAEVAAVYDEILQTVSYSVWGVNDQNMAGTVRKVLASKQLTIAVAESCTGGLIQKLLTDIPKSSSCYMGGIIAYSNKAKEKILGIDKKIIADYGAVSMQVAAKMAENVAAKFSADIGLSVTGIAGPDGGTDKKPVGTVWFSLSKEDDTISIHKHFKGSRDLVRKKAADYLLYFLISYL